MMAIKIVTVGSGAVGKSTLLRVFTGDKFPAEYVPTVFDNYSTNLTVDGCTVSLGLWDTAGQGDYDRLRPLSYPETDLVIMCYSVGDLKSFADVENKWLREVRDNMPNVPIMLVGTKSDLRDDAEHVQKLHDHGFMPIFEQEGAAMARLIGARGFCECSALKQEGIQEIFEQAVRVIRVIRTAAHKMSSPAQLVAEFHSSALSLSRSSCMPVSSMSISEPGPEDQFPFNELPLPLQFQVLSNLSMPDRTNVAVTSTSMLTLEIFSRHNTQLSEEQINHLQSWRVSFELNNRRQGAKIEDVLLVAAARSRCPATGSQLKIKKLAVSNGARWLEVKDRDDLTKSHITALCIPENQDLICQGKMTVPELFDSVTESQRLQLTR